MTRLLVSVRDVDEARTACEAGADLIDVKEPRHGALGAASAETIAAVHAAVGGHVPTSAALGELLHDHSEALAAAMPSGLNYAKIGLAGCASVNDWPRRWQRAIGGLPVGTSPVAVVYADWRTAEAPQPAEVLSQAIELGCPVVLIDTYAKRGQGLLDLWPISEVESFATAVRQTGRVLVLAGSLSTSTIASVRHTADYIAVRGAACGGGREGRVDRRRVEMLAQLLSAAQLRQQ